LKSPKSAATHEAFHCSIGKNEVMKKHLLLFLAFLLSGMSGQLIAQTYDGFTFYAPQNGTQAYLLNMSGGIYHSWTFNSSDKTGYSTYLLNNRILLRTVARSGNSFTGGPICGQVQKVDWDGNVIWNFVYSTTDYCSHHDVCAMPNGNVLMIVYERKTASEVSLAGSSQSIEMWPDKIVEIEPSGASGGTVVWEWHIWDHLCQNIDPLKANYVSSISDHPELMNINYNTTKDWTHLNGIDYNPELDQITFSSHSLNEIYVIDHSTTTAEAASHSGGNSGKGGDFLYRWGNPAAYQMAGVADFNVVHDAHWVPADNPKYAGFLAGFNNKGGAGNKSCVDIISPPYNGYNYSFTAGNAYGPATFSERITYSGSATPDNGNSHQLPNGNTLICTGMSSVIYEVDSNQNVVWTKNTGTTLVQAFRFNECYVLGPAVVVSASATTVSSGASVDLSAAATSPSGSSPVYSYNWTSIPSGFSSTLQNPSITPGVTTTYYCTVTDYSCGCSNLDSVTINVSSGLTDSHTPGELLLYPNPASDQIHIVNEFDNNDELYLQIYNELGQLVQSCRDRRIIDVSTFENGIYSLLLKTSRNAVFAKRILVIH
jgi:hypothetical protein